MAKRFVVGEKACERYADVDISTVQTLEDLKVGIHNEFGILQAGSKKTMFRRSLQLFIG
jgi:hypothetical protein